ncbi:uncharacterized membrane protein YcaP (DUF421 family) [Paenibacillus taihuensis]|uniref:Uncharacterized membrane protein YcaP (DUF421 family) n=1 Tax=Paenibacillus taihuensis TaxID=1156355 RepID=A0A3D9SHZ9_9BACL|nr:DUF421 domain-containing protein [Paenibacillus taihuensis]REE91498.1 uncharacterized membrane protein YcaP (DUF421 family) [Paenibacillus taihuensis]
MSEHILILIRSIAAFVLLLIITRLIGKQTLSNMNIHEFVTAIILGAISANLAFNDKINTSHLLISLCVFTVTSWLISFVTLKSRKSERWLFGKPCVLIEDGKLLEENMKKNKYTLDSLNEMLREKDIFDIAEVQYALLEVNGKLSVQKKKEYRNFTLKDFQSLSKIEQKTQPKKPSETSPAMKSKYPIELIMEGKLIPENLRIAEMEPHAIEEVVCNTGYTISDVFYAVRGTDGKFYFDFYEDRLSKPMDL